MTEATNPETNETEESAEVTEPEAETSETADASKGNPEAARWRVKFREAETTISTLTERVTAMQRREVVRLATGPGSLIDGEDVFRTGELADLLTEDGDVDPEAVSEAVAAVRESKPHLGSPAFGDGLGLGERNPSKGTTWADVISG